MVRGVVGLCRFEFTAMRISKPEALGALFYTGRTHSLADARVASFVRKGFVGAIIE